MCGRARLTYAEDELVQLYTRVVRREREAAASGAGGVGGGGTGEDIRWFGRSAYRPSPNVPPTSSLPVLSRPESEDDGLAIETMRWGFYVGSPEPHFVINARSEKAASVAKFSRSLASPYGRGVLAVEGYYEWKEEGSAKKQPFFVYRTDGKPLLLAVLVDRGSGEEGDASSPTPRFAVLTRKPPDVLRWLHDRAPCILPTEEAAAEWLSPPKGGGGKVAAAAKVLFEAGTAVEELSSSSEGGKGTAAPLLSWHPVTAEMGKTSYQKDDASKDIRKGGIAALFAAATAVKKETSSLAAAKEEKTTPPPPMPPLAPHSRVKREHGTTGLSQATNTKKPKTTTTTPKGQRSLDAFFSPKQEKEKA